MDDWCYEVPAGGLSEGLTPEVTVRQELLEEIGGLASQFRCMDQFYTCHGISRIAYGFLAADVEPGKASSEPTALLEVRLVSAEDALPMARRGKMGDGPSALATLCCESIMAKAHHGTNGPRAKPPTQGAVGTGGDGPQSEGGACHIT